MRRKGKRRTKYPEFILNFRHTFSHIILFFDLISWCALCRGVQSPPSDQAYRHRSRLALGPSKTPPVLLLASCTQDPQTCQIRSTAPVPPRVLLKRKPCRSPFYGPKPYLFLRSCLSGARFAVPSRSSSKVNNFAPSHEIYTDYYM